MPLYRSLEEISLDDVSHFGGKAARLGEAKRIGCPVLDGVALSTELNRRFMRQGGLHGEISSILNSMQPVMITQFQAVEWAIQSAFKARRMPKSVADVIREAWEALGGVPLAVRSSATREDSPNHSFVGQHATCLDIESPEAAIEAVLTCWASLFSAKALSYAQRFWVDLLNSSMAVLMQPMISPRIHGELSTVNPVRGNPDVFLLEVRDSPDGDVLELDPYVRQPGEPPAWSQLRRLGLLLDEHLTSYQALEWAICDDESLYLMRVRPVTGVPAYLSECASDTSLALAPVPLVRQPDREPRSLAPYSWYHRSRSPRLNAAYADGSRLPFSRYSGRDEFYVCGYLYGRWRESGNNRWATLGAAARRAAGLRRLHAARNLDRDFRMLWREKRPRMDALNELELSTLSDHELSLHFEEIAALTEAFQAELGRLGDAGTALFEVLCYFQSLWSSDEPASCTDLVWTADDQTSRIGEAFCELARRTHNDDDERERALASFYRRHRHYFAETSPLAEWSDICKVDPNEAKARSAFAHWSHSTEPSLCEQNAARVAARDQAERRALGRLGTVRGALFARTLRMARRYLVAGRDSKEASELCHLLEHDAVQEVGRRLLAEGMAGSLGEGCLLEYREIVEWLRGTLGHDTLVRLLLQRKDLERRWARLTPPTELHADRLDSGDLSTLDPEEDVLRGRPISPGSATGRARLIRTLVEATHVVPGEILVCSEVRFEYSPLFSMVGAVVADKGGLLDHAAVLAREYGVPAVFGVNEATKRIRSGEIVEVNATTGIVRWAQSDMERRQPDLGWRRA